MNYSEYLNIISQDSTIYKSLSGDITEIAKFYKVQSQKNNYFIENSIKRFSDTFSSYGISDNALFSNNRKYILVIDPTEDLPKQVRFAESMIPVGKPFNTLAILSDDQDLIKSTYEIISNNFRGIQLLNFVENDSEDFYIDMVTEETNLGKDKLFDLKPYCDLIDSVGVNSPSYLKTFSNTIDRILIDNEDRKIYFYAGDNGTNGYFVYKLLVSELYLRRKDKFYVYSSERESVGRMIMSSIFNKDCNLIEDLYSYVNNMPSLLIGNDNYFSSYNLVTSTQMNLHIRYTYFNSSDSSAQVFEEVIDYRDINIVSLYELYNLKKAEDTFEFKARIDSLYELLSLHNDETCSKNLILDATKIIVFTQGTHTYIGYVKDIGISAKVKCITNFAILDKTMSYDEIIASYPACFYVDSYKATNLAKNLASKYGLDLSKLKMKTPKFRRKLTTLLSNSPLPVNSDWSLVDLDTLGLYGLSNIRCRWGFIDNLIGIKGIDEVRKEVDIYGGYNPATSKEIVI